jgi:hypothetical protein
LPVRLRTARRQRISTLNQPENQTVIIGGRTWPKDRPWIIAISLATVAAVAWYGVEWATAGRMPGGSSRPGFAFGVVGGAIILFELLLWPRRRVRSWRLGSAQAWLRAHVWLGLFCVPLVLMHARLLFIGGLLNVALMTLFVIVIVSGVWGLVLQQYLPRMLLDEVPAETIREQIDHVAAREAADVGQLVAAMCEPLAHGGEPSAADDGGNEFAVVTGFRAMTGIQGRVLETLPLHAVIPGTREIARRFHDDVRPYLLAGEAGGSPLAGRREADAFFAGLRAAAPVAAAAVIDRVQQACEHRRQFDLQARLHDRLHGWLLVHMPLSVALGVLLAVHVPIALWYW